MIQRQCPSAEVLMRVLLCPDSDEARSLRSHIENCPYCRYCLDLQKTEFGDLQKAWNDQPKHGIICLLPLPENESPDMPGLKILAAKGEETGNDFQALVLVSSDWKIVMRAVRDNHSGEIWLYLLAEDSAICRNVLVKPFGLKKEYLTDDDGRVNIGKIGWPSGRQLKAELILPKATFSLAPLSMPPEAAGSTDLKSEQGDRIRVSMTGRSRNIQLTVKLLKISSAPENQEIRVAIRNKGRLECWNITSSVDGQAVFDKLSDMDSLEIYLYY